VPNKRTDRELLRQLDEAKRSGRAVKVVVKLQRPQGQAPVPADIEAQAQRAVTRAAEASGQQPTDVHVMGRMAVAYVSGSESFVRELVDQPEVTGAVANDDAREH
jgi:hypothetical protein